MQWHKYWTSASDCVWCALDADGLDVELPYDPKYDMVWAVTYALRRGTPQERADAANEERNHLLDFVFALDAEPEAD